MKTNIYKKITAVFIIFCFVLSACPAVRAEKEKTDKTIVIAGSDFQAETALIGRDNVNAIFGSIKKAGYEKADAFLFAGDYDVDKADQSYELNTLKETVKAAYPEMSEENMVFGQGNHDNPETKGLSQSGSRDTESYGVFVINEDDYPLGGGYESTVKSTAEKLEEYLGKRLEENKDKPVFVVSHVPLHYSYRTINVGDAKYASHIFEVLNRYGEELNIIFLFGHNHSSDFDNYVGGSSIYFAKGDKIYIAQNGKQNAVPDERTLNFTYLNAGYVGFTYCLGNNLTMTVFEIDGNNVKVRRFDPYGECYLKINGDWSENYDDNNNTYGLSGSYLSISYASPQYIGNSAADGNVTVYSKQVTSLDVVKTTEKTNASIQQAYASYDISAEGVSEGEKAAVVISLERGFLEARPIFVKDKNSGDISVHYAKDGKLVFETDKLSSYELTQHKNAVITKENVKAYVYTDSLNDGGRYIIATDIEAGEACAMSDTDGNILPLPVTVRNGFDGVYLYTDDLSAVWTYEKDTDNEFDVSIGRFKNDLTGKYLASDDKSSVITKEKTEFIFGTWRLSSGAYGLYTLADTQGETRYNLKFDTEFYISKSSESAKRVFVFEESAVVNTVKACIDRTEASIETGVGNNTLTGIKIYVVSDDGTKETIDVTVDMLKASYGSSIDTSVDRTYENVSVYYRDTKIFSECVIKVGDGVYKEPPQESAVSTEASVEENSNGFSNDITHIVIISGVVLAVVLSAAVVSIIFKKKK